MLPLDTMIAKFSCEIATLKFLHDKTSVRVPKLIGYGLGNDDDIRIPFMITQNVNGLPLSIYWGRFGKNTVCVERILNSLAQQYLELLSHPFSQIGSLRLTVDGKGWEIGTSPISVDQFDISRDGFKIALSNPHHSSLDYYITQTQAFERYTNEQRNSVFDEQDAILKYVTSEAFRRLIPHFLNRQFNNGPYFLFHLDLHANNVITNSKWEVEAILDWEFTSALPIEIAFSPPRCIMERYRENEMHCNSDNYKLYESRLRIFAEKVENHLASSYSNLSRLAPLILSQLHKGLAENGPFFAWSVSDVRNMFDLFWDHLALTTPIAIESKGAIGATVDIIFKTKQQLIDEMLQILGDKKAKDWVAERLVSLDAYILERDGYKQEKQFGELPADQMVPKD